MFLKFVTAEIYVRYEFVFLIGRVSLARENEAGAFGGRKSIFSMLTYRILLCFWL